MLNFRRRAATRLAESATRFSEGIVRLAEDATRLSDAAPGRNKAAGPQTNTAKETSPPLPATVRTGRDGEEAAARFLADQGWAILDRNWRSGPLELDLVCREGDTLVFVEVKTRAGNGLTSPSDAFTPAKRGRVIRAARAWLAAHDAWDCPCRFDLAAVTFQNGLYHTELMRHVIELDAASRGRPGHSMGGGHAPWQPW